jgi:hypothetical protein
MRRYLIGQDDDGRWSLSFERATVGAFTNEDDTAAAAIVLARRSGPVGHCYHPAGPLAFTADVYTMAHIPT